MNSRRMESAAAPASGENVTAMLRSLLERPRIGAPDRLLAVGWNEVADLDSLAAEAVSSAGLETAGEEPYDAVLWRTEAADLAALRRVRGLLAADGRLVLHAGAAEGVSDDAVARRLVRCLSEAGFAVLRELDPAGVGGRGGSAFVARRDDFSIRPFREGDDAAVEQLFVDSFHGARGSDHWRWKYDENPFGGRCASLAFAPEGKLAAHYAGYPVPFWCDGRSFVALHMADTMTAPRFRRVGRGVTSLLARTVRHFFAIHRRGPFEFFYGFNTGGIQRFCRWFIGGSQLEPVRYLARERREPLPPPARGYRVRRVGRTDPAWDRLFRGAAHRYGFLVRRDAEYVDWRYLRCPDGEPYVVLAAHRWGRLVGWSVFRRRQERLAWGDAFFAPRHAAAAGAVLAAALAAPELAGTELVEGWFSNRPAWWNAELERLGFASRPQPDGLGFMILPDAEDEPPLARLYYTMGDGDLF